MNRVQYNSKIFFFGVISSELVNLHTRSIRREVYRDKELLKLINPKFFIPPNKLRGTHEWRYIIHFEF